MDFVGTIKNLCAERRIPISRLEKECGFGNGYIRQLTKGVMPYDRMEKVANYLNVPLSDLFKGGQDELFTIPVMGYVRAGQPLTEYSAVIDRLPAKYANNEEYFGLMIKGDSMEPRFYEGDVVIVHSQPDAENGQIVVAQINGDEAVVKKLIKFAHGIALQSLNPAYPLLQFAEEEIEKKPVRILGRVVESRARF